MLVHFWAAVSGPLGVGGYIWVELAIGHFHLVWLMLNLDHSIWVIFLMKSKIGSVWHEIAFQGQVHLVLGIESVKGLLILKVTSHLIFMVQRLKPR